MKAGLEAGDEASHILVLEHKQNKKASRPWPLTFLAAAAAK